MEVICASTSSSAILRYCSTERLLRDRSIGGPRTPAQAPPRPGSAWPARVREGSACERAGPGPSRRTAPRGASGPTAIWFPARCRPPHWSKSSHSKNAIAATGAGQWWIPAGGRQDAAVGVGGGVARSRCGSSRSRRRRPRRSTSRGVQQFADGQLGRRRPGTPRRAARALVTQLIDLGGVRTELRAPTRSRASVAQDWTTRRHPSARGRRAVLARSPGRP